MDLKVLFHNPESLSDEELLIVRDKIRRQSYIPKFSALIGGFAVYALEAAVLKQAWCRKRVAVGAVAGYLIGGFSTYNYVNSVPRLEGEKDFVQAFDKRYVSTVLNTTGFGSNYVSIRDYSDATGLKKPYV